MLGFLLLWLGVRSWFRLWTRLRLRPRRGSGFFLLRRHAALFGLRLGHRLQLGGLLLDARRLLLGSDRVVLARTGLFAGCGGRELFGLGTRTRPAGSRFALGNYLTCGAGAGCFRRDDALSLELSRTRRRRDWRTAIVLRLASVGSRLAICTCSRCRAVGPMCCWCAKACCCSVGGTARPPSPPL